MNPHPFELLRLALVAGIGLSLAGPALAGGDALGADDLQYCRVLGERGPSRTYWVDGVDTDGDGVPDAIDADSDGDGIPDVLEGTLDLDGDGLPAFLDLDSDGDGIPDAIEALPTSMWRRLMNRPPGAPIPMLPVTFVLADTDGDGHPDAYDADSDGDGLPDALEAGLGTFAPVDVDRDGLADDVDMEPCGWGPPDGGIRAPLAFFPDRDAGLGSGEVDWRDPLTDDGSAFLETGAWTTTASSGVGPLHDVAVRRLRHGADRADGRFGTPVWSHPEELAGGTSEREATPGGRPAHLDSHPDRHATGQEEDMGINPLNASSGCSTTGGPQGLGALLLAALSLGATRRRRGALLAAAGLIAVPGLAAAQDGPALNIQRFDPNPQPATFTIVRDAEQPMRGTVSGALSVNYGLNPLQFNDADNVDIRGDVVDHLVGLDLGFNAAPLDWLELGLNMPIYQAAMYESARAEGTAQALGGSGDTHGVGDLTVSVGLAPLQQRLGAPFNLSLIPRVVIPTGTRDIFTGSGSVQAGGDVAIGRSWEHFRFSVTGGYLWQDDSELVGDIYVDDTARWGAALGIPWNDRQFEVDIEYAGAHVVTDDAREAVGDFDWDRHTPMELLAGFLYRPNNLPLYLKAGLGPGMPTGWGTPEVRAFVTVGARTLPRARLEPIAAISDADGDGIADEFDVCPYKPEDFDGFQDTDGCPDTDNDNDGIPDVADACINRPEVYNGFEDTDGCPDQAVTAVEVQEDEIVLYDKVYFEYDRAQLRPVSKRVLDEVANTLRENPGISLVELAGHADERGPEWYNLELSRQRAMSVRNYLISQGVEADRLRISAFGEEFPVIEDADDEGEYALNRRVQLIVEMTDDDLELDNIKTVDADVPAIPEGFDPPNIDGPEYPG